MEFRTLKTTVAEAVSHNVIARIRERATGNIQIIFVENFEGKIDDFKKKFVAENKTNYSLAWAVFAPVDESKYDEVIEAQEKLHQERNEKSKMYHKEKRENKEVEA